MFQPRYPQPFSIAEAEQLDVSTIVAEISRLQNSISHLEESQTELISALNDEEDPDLRSAWQENQGVIASQNERIEMLKHVLEGKVGREALGHYGITPTGGSTPAVPNPTPTSAHPNGSFANGNRAEAEPLRPNGDRMDEDEGVFL